MSRVFESVQVAIAIVNVRTKNRTACIAVCVQLDIASSVPFYGETQAAQHFAETEIASPQVLSAYFL